MPQCFQSGWTSGFCLRLCLFLLKRNLPIYLWYFLDSSLSSFPSGAQLFASFKASLYPWLSHFFLPYINLEFLHALLLFNTFLGPFCFLVVTLTYCIRKYHFHSQFCSFHSSLLCLPACIMYLLRISENEGSSHLSHIKTFSSQMTMLVMKTLVNIG